MKLHILEWYKRIKDPIIRNQALNNYNPEFSGNDNDVVLVSSIAYAIGEGFRWNYSPQGEKYWEDIHHKLINNEKYLEDFLYDPVDLEDVFNKLEQKLDG